MTALKTVICLAVLGMLCACGADGPPTRPGAAPQGVSVTGEARIGVTQTL